MTTNTKIIGGYFPGWAIHARGYHVSDIPGDKLTHVNYAFAGVSTTSECVSINPQDDQINFPALQLMKQQRPAIKTLISIGGASNSSNFPKAAEAQARQSFAQSCISFMKSAGFDGIDIDWEFPTSTDKPNYTALLKELRTQLDAQGLADGKHYLLTAALPAKVNEYANFELGQIHQYLDWVNLMAYNFYTASNLRTAFSAPLYASSTDPDPNKTNNVDSAVKAYLAASIPAAKIVVGVPFFGTGWEGVPNANNGLYQPASGPAQGTWQKDGIFDYDDLVSNYVGSYLRFWNTEASAPSLYNPGTGIMISYEDAQSVGLKSDYIIANHLAGAIIWQLSADDEQRSLLNALEARFNPPSAFQSSPPPASTILTNATRSIAKATLVPLMADVSNETATEGHAIIKSGYVRQVSLQPGEVSAVREEIARLADVSPQDAHLSSTSPLWDLLTSFEGQVMPSLLPSASEVGRIPAADLQTFGKALAGVRKQVVNQISSRLPSVDTVMDVQGVGLAAPMSYEAGVGIEVAKAQYFLHQVSVANTVFAVNTSVSPIGMLNLERLEMAPAGIERGELIATIPLAPGEKTAVVQKEWSVTTKEFTSIVTDSLENFSETGVTDNTELAQSTASQIQHANQFNITATVSGGIPLISGSSTASFGIQDSSSKSATDSRKHAVAVTQKASSRTKQEHKVTISTTTVTGTSETTTRELVNTSMTDPIRIDYFSMMRKWRVRLYRYGLRLTYDMVIPEPAGALRKAYATLAEKQGELVPFEFKVPISEITTDIWAGEPQPHYLVLAEKYSAQVPLPPGTLGPTLTPNGVVPGLNDGQGWHFFQLPFTVPDGYWITNVTVDAHIGIGDQYGANAFAVERVYEKHDGRQQLSLHQPSDLPDGFLKHYTGNQNVTFFFQWCNTGWVGMTITTEQTDARKQQWQIDVWNALYNAAQTQHYARQQDLAAQIAQIEDQLKNVDTLTLRREESDEIMKGVLRFLLGPDFDFMPPDVLQAIKDSGADIVHGVGFTGNALGLSKQALTTVRQHEDKVRFINQAIEWENVVSFLYSYFWDVPDSWDFIRQIKHPDANRQAFLRAGAARVVLTVRKGWEEAWVRFAEGGFMDAPVPDNHPYLSIAKEIAAYDERNYPGIPPANPGQSAVRLEDALYATSTVALLPLMNSPLTNVEIEVDSSAGFLVGALVVIDSRVEATYADNVGRQERTTITAIRDATHMTVAQILYPHGGTNMRFIILQPGEKGALIAEWNEYTPTSGTDIAVTSNLATIA